MTPEEQRIEIARACGWKCGIAKGAANWHPAHRGYSTDESKVNGLPDYLNDLNAMHEAERVMNPGEQFHYSSILIRILGHEDNGMVELSDFDLLHATASQRAEAFLKTLNLWKP